MAQTKKISAVEGYGITGVTVRFSVKELYTLKELIHQIDHSDATIRHDAAEKLQVMWMNMSAVLESAQKDNIFEPMVEEVQ